MEKGRATRINTVFESILNQRFIIKTGAVFNLDDQMRACKYRSILADEMVVPIIVGYKLKHRCGVDYSAGNVFRMGACLQTDPQLEEVGVLHHAPLQSSRCQSRGSLAPPDSYWRRVGIVPSYRDAQVSRDPESIKRLFATLGNFYRFV